MFLAVSFIVPSDRLTTENARIGGDHDTPVKKLNGARFVWPALLIDDTHAIGRGIMELVRRSWACLDSNSIKFISTVYFPSTIVFDNRDREEPRDSPPPTPPGIRITYPAESGID
jgi:hypothetical protein